MTIRPDPRSGFTVIELLLVIVVIGILAAIAIPKIDRARYQVDAGVQTVATTLLAAQRAALTQEHDVAVSFDVPGRKMVVLYDADNDGVADAGERVRRVVLEPVLALSRGGASARPMGAGVVNLTRTVGGLPAVIFHRNGSASSAGGLYLTTVRAAADTSGRYRQDVRAIEIVRATGRTEWWRYINNAWQRGF